MIIQGRPANLDRPPLPVVQGGRQPEKIDTDD
ncbi:hypothetical protein PSAL_016360 [Pseudooceanicola algae]|uniref:Uncharacterized protein n=1 Tax=Pseudooceanicola algae TaxID=1537215 RepID=A0A418SH77_9RHOB|nr:hypothetical protein PSAL_016360 [Pseudooceanicola algae]